MSGLWDIFSLSCFFFNFFRCFEIWVLCRSLDMMVYAGQGLHGKYMWDFFFKIFLPYFCWFTYKHSAILIVGYMQRYGVGEYCIGHWLAGTRMIRSDPVVDCVVVFTSFFRLFTEWEKMEEKLLCGLNGSLAVPFCCVARYQKRQEKNQFTMGIERTLIPRGDSRTDIIL